MLENPPTYAPKTIIQDMVAGMVVFFVAVPLCLGIALASGAPLFSGLVAGIIGGIIVTLISGSHTSVSGPAAGLTAIVAAQITLLGSFEAFLLAVAIAGVIQIGFGIAKGGALSAFFPSSVIKGLLAAIGVILILKQIPHLLGRDKEPLGDVSFAHDDGHTTFSEIWAVIQGEIHLGAMVIGLLSLAILIIWDRIPVLKKSLIPSPLLVVLFGVGMTMYFSGLGETWLIDPEEHLVQIPIANSPAEFFGFLTTPDFSQILNPAIFIAAITIALVASLETLLNLEAIDKLDRYKRNSPPSRELIAQGCGNLACGLIGGIPVTSVIVRGSVNVLAGGKTKNSSLFHGIFLLIAVALLPTYMNMIPLSALAAILFTTGLKLASLGLMRQMWNEGHNQFIPFIVTLVSIVFTDLLIGILIGLGVSVLFILQSNLRRPIRRIVETHLGGDVIHIELANQVSFLNRASLDRIFNETEPGSQLLIDASDTHYIDPDVLSLIRDYKTVIAPKRGVSVSLKGFQEQYKLEDDIQYADYSTRDLQDLVTADQVIKLLKEGNQRFVAGKHIARDFHRQIDGTKTGQNPFAIILSCIDSRVPAELVFDLGIGDIFSARVAGNIVGTKTMGSIEYSVAVAKVKLVVVLGHTRCGAVTSSIQLITQGTDAMTATGCENLQRIVDEISISVKNHPEKWSADLPQEEQERIVDDVASRNVLLTVEEIYRRSAVVRTAVDEGRLKVVGALYDVKSGKIDFYDA